MKKGYDEIINQHYKEVAKEYGHSSKSTMLDEITRHMETEAIIQFVGESLRLHESDDSSETATIMDVGCGNGYTLDQLVSQYPNQNYVGIEKSNELRALASLRFQGNDKVKILEGDIRDKDFAKGINADILVCQRVLINLLAIEDQKYALNNIVAVVQSASSWKAEGTLLFIEGFVSPLTRLNKARSEFNLPPIPPSHHNLYLPDDFFEIPQLRPLRTDSLLPPPNFLSTHYYVARVLHTIFTPENEPLNRNSEFAKFFTHALNQNVGDYSPLKLYIFENTKEA